jgi:hypothetical protein
MSPTSPASSGMEPEEREESLDPSSYDGPEDQEASCLGAVMYSHPRKVRWWAEVGFGAAGASQTCARLCAPCCACGVVCDARRGPHPTCVRPQPGARCYQRYTITGMRRHVSGQGRRRRERPRGGGDGRRGRQQGEGALDRRRFLQCGGWGKTGARRTWSKPISQPTAPSHRSVHALAHRPFPPFHRIQGSALSVVEFVAALSCNVSAALELPCWEAEQLRVRCCLLARAPPRRPMHAVSSSMHAVSTHAAYGLALDCP